MLPGAGPPTVTASPKHVHVMIRPYRRIFSRLYKVLAIESSCDDTCVSLIDRFSPNQPPLVIDQLKSTLDSVADGGVIPIKAHLHHQKSLAHLVQEISRKNGVTSQAPPDLVCVARGPGMAGSLTVGLELAKGLSIAYDKPLVGVHHMLGHLLVSRMASNGRLPQFPFISLLVSGGHTILVHSKSVLEHEILAETIDIAAGDSLDKCAREIGMKGVMLGKELEKFVSEEPLDPEFDRSTMEIPSPLANKAGRVNMTAFAFSSFITAVKKNIQVHYGEISNVLSSQLRGIGYQIQQAIFGHIADKIALTLREKNIKGVKDFVCSGGVGANLYLRDMLQTRLAQDFERFHFPPPQLCTDNAVMIGWAGIELWEAQKFQTDLSALPLRKWSLEELSKVKN